MRTAPSSLSVSIWSRQALYRASIERGSAAGTELADALVEQVDVVGEGLGDIGLDVEAFDKGTVVAVQNLKKELDGGVLLELEALADGAARCRA